LRPPPNTMAVLFAKGAIGSVVDIDMMISEVAPAPLCSSMRG
jgi:hypothetical protein